MRINAENFAAIQTLSTALSLSLARTHLRAAEASDVCDRRLLWRFGISGDLPIVLVSAGVEQGLGLLRSLAQALRLWSWGGIACDLVIVNHEPASYLMPLSRAIASLREAHAAAIAAQPGSGATGFHLLQSSDCIADETATLRALARVRFNADGRPLAHHVQELAELHERSFQARQGLGGRPRQRDGDRSRALPDRRAATSRPPAANSASTSARCRGRRGRGSTSSPTPASARRSARPAAATAGRSTAA